MDKKTRIQLLLLIDGVFFFIELITGYAVGSLALLADAFHMLNDVLSFVVALYAVEYSKRGASATFSYGWQRAELLGALINGVFLLALCFSIFMSAIERLLGTPDVQNPWLVVTVGSCGLLTNLIGLLLLHDHSHGSEDPSASSHAGHDHHQHESPYPAHSDIEAHGSSRHRSNTDDHYPNTKTPLLRHPPTYDSSMQSEENNLYVLPSQMRSNIMKLTREQLANTSEGGVTDNYSPQSHSQSQQLPLQSDNSSLAQSPSLGDYTDCPIEDHVEQPEFATAPNPSSKSSSKKKNSHLGHHNHNHRHGGPSHVSPGEAIRNEHDHSSNTHTHDHAHTHAHSHGASSGSIGHGHGDHNMQGVFLHVLGDAFGNVGVIVAGLFIALSSWKYRSYADPLISILITILIFSTTLPMVKSVSAIFLQGVPPNVSLYKLANALQSVKGVKSIHELHVWSLSESKNVASVHIIMEPCYDFNKVSSEMRCVMHEFNIHSSTIQPETASASVQSEIDLTAIPHQEAVILKPSNDSKDTSCPVQCVTENCRRDSCCHEN